MTAAILTLAAGLWLAPAPIVQPGRAPLRLVLLVDVTTRPALSRDELRELTEQVIRILGPDDRASIWRVGGGVAPGPALTRDPRVLREAARRVIQPPPAETSGPSPIWDALVAASAALERESGRRMVLIVTDGRATGNRYRYTDAAARAKSAGVEISAIGPLTVDGFFSDSRAVSINPERGLQALASHTGGTFVPYSGEGGGASASVRRAITGEAPVLAAMPAAPPAQKIKSGVELVRVDVQVTGRDGGPAADLRPDQFEVRIDGSLRPVKTIEFVRYAAGATTPAARLPATPARPGEDGRTIILAVDQGSFLLTTEPAAVEVVTRIASMASPTDAIGLVAYPAPGVTLAPTRDRKALVEAARKIAGQLHLPRGRIVLSLAEAVDWTTDADFRRRLIQRFCPAGDLLCAREVEMAATETVIAFQMQASRSIGGLHGVVDAVREYPGRKTFVIVSAGFPMSDRMGGQPDVAFEAEVLGKRAAQANAVLYSLHLDVSFLYAFSAANAGPQLQTVFRDSQMLAGGLERFTGSGGGTVITVHAGPDAALQRLLRETSAYYLLGVEPLPAHRDGELHRIQVTVNERGAVARSRTTVLIPKPPK